MNAILEKRGRCDGCCSNII